MAGRFGSICQSSPCRTAPDDRAAWQQISRLEQEERGWKLTLSLRIRELGLDRFSKPANVMALKSALPADAALVDFVRVFANKYLTGGSPTAGWRMIAFVVPPGSPGGGDRPGKYVGN